MVCVRMQRTILLHDIGQAPGPDVAGRDLVAGSKHPREVGELPVRIDRRGRQRDAPTVAEILEAVADRSAIEQNFHDIKEVHGAGQQQLRNYWANIAAYHLILWLHTLIEVWSWHKPKEELVDRSASPWDDESLALRNAPRALADDRGRRPGLDRARHADIAAHR